MAIEWLFLDPDDNTRYEVRSAGSSLRLYTNGAFHTQYSPKHLFTGGVWDLLSIPVLFQGQAKHNKVLMLGVGGGSAIHQINYLIKPDLITGIEFNPVHLLVAKRFFNVVGKNIDLVEADAFHWLKRNRRKYQVVIDDLFVDSTADPVRPFANDSTWLSQLHASLGKNGILIQNHLSRRAAKKIALQASAYFETALLFTVPQYENVVLALYKNKIDLKQAKASALLSIEAFGQTAKKLRFNVKQVY